MELYFNELSLSIEGSMEYIDMQNLAALYREAGPLGIRTCRIHPNDFVTLLSAVQSIPGVNANLMNFLYAFFKSPYESDAVDARQDAYLCYEWHLGDRKCYGLSLAYIMQSLGVSISQPEWRHTMLRIKRDNAELEVHNAFDGPSLIEQRDWIECQQPPSLRQSALLPTLKSINLRDDHGKDKLTAFCKRIVQSPYVLGVINSLPFNSHERKFIHDVHSDGRVEIVLPWTDQGLGIVIQTTGQNMRETEAIAEILKTTYCQL